jgi:hypothetical protein
MNRPLLLVDVDGVISLFGFDPARPPDGNFQTVDGITHFLSAEAARHLRELSQFYEPAWCTGWEEKANEYLPHALGLPGPWPYLEFAGPAAAGAGHWKLDAIDRYAGRSRAVAWIDDGHDERCRDWSRQRSGPTLLVTTDPAAGLTAEHVATLLQFVERANTGGSCVATSNQVAPASADPNISPVVVPKYSSSEDPEPLR